MNELLPKSKVSRLAWFLVILYLIVFSIGSLATCWVAALTGKDWSALTGTQKFIIWMAVITNWTLAMKDFIRQALEKIQSYYNDKAQPASEPQPPNK